MKLDASKIPRNAGIARTIADEIVVSKKVAALLRGNKFSGYDLQPVDSCRYGKANSSLQKHGDASRRGKPQSDEQPWYQLVIKSKPVSLLPGTKVGIHPFDEDPEGRYKCPLGHVVGLNLLSEAWVRRSDWDGSDITASRELIGVRRGLLVPRPVLLMSNRLATLLRNNQFKGHKEEVAYLA